MFKQIFLLTLFANFCFWPALASSANVRELGPRYQVLKEYVLSTKRNVRYEATATQMAQNRRRTNGGGNAMATAEFFPGFGTSANGSECVDMDGKRRPNGAEYERHNGHFMYRCNNGMEEAIACFGTERAGRARIPIGQTVRIDGFWHKCEKYTNGSVIYTQESSCTSGNKDYRVGEEILVGNLRMVCGDLGYSVAGCFIDEKRILVIGQDFVEPNRVHRCYRVGITVEYTSYGCGFSGGPSCKPPPIPRSPDDEVPVAKSLLSPAVGQLVVGHLLNMAKDRQQNVATTNG